MSACLGPAIPTLKSSESGGERDWVLVIGQFQNNVKGHDSHEIHFSDPYIKGHFLRLTLLSDRNNECTRAVIYHVCPSCSKYDKINFILSFKLFIFLYSFTSFFFFEKYTKICPGELLSARRTLAF